jgi:hypothetical protein
MTWTIYDEASTVPDNAWSPRVKPGWYAEWLLMIYGRELIVMTRVWGRPNA